MSNDPTEPQGGGQYDTTPGVTTILERINQVHTNLVERIDQIHTDLVDRISGVSTEMRQGDSAILNLIGEARGELLERINQVQVETLQSNSTMMIRFNDIEGQVRLTNAKLDVFGKDLLDTKAHVRDVQTRVGELERKVS